MGTTGIEPVKYEAGYSHIATTLTFPCGWTVRALRIINSPNFSDLGAEEISRGLVYKAFRHYIIGNKYHRITAVVPVALNLALLGLECLYGIFSLLREKACQKPF